MRERGYHERLRSKFWHVIEVRARGAEFACECVGVCVSRRVRRGDGGGVYVHRVSVHTRALTR